MTSSSLKNWFSSNPVESEKIGSDEKRVEYVERFEKHFVGKFPLIRFLNGKNFREKHLKQKLPRKLGKMVCHRQKANVCRDEGSESVVERRKTFRKLISSRRKFFNLNRLKNPHKLI